MATTGKLSDVLEGRHNGLTFGHFERLDAILHLVIACDLDLGILSGCELARGGR